MATSKVLLASVFLSLLVLHQVHAVQTNQATSNAIPQNDSSMKIDCGGACAVRCQLSSRPNLCKRACGTCCARCNCVPPGTSGNYDACPCYASLTTKDNKRKCP
ncbi:snakin-2 [Olea europaea subsp. europaea]|uniref:Snakin-2 n=1 Tax=Olea europaea subsp. europaea TaxID=158383 RepID=A0A8S0UTS0_OLEEU|nr:snakin-2 [Olea europaea subsp. europaea]